MLVNYEQKVSEESKMRSPDRLLVLKVMDGKKPLDVGLQVDPRLFKEGDNINRLHAVMDLETSLWSLKYEKGAVPQVLGGRYTGFVQLLNHARTYYGQRNIEITEIKD